MRLDITGLGSYRHRDVPKWYDDLDEKARWQAQANFWDAIAKTCANSPAVFFYDLINEPIVPNEKTKVWMVGHLGDFDYCQHITRDPAGRNRDAISRQWTRMMVSAIRKNDPQHLISIGLLPFDQKTFGESGFSANAIAPEVDFLCTHLYPQSKKLDESLRTLKSFQVGKPVVIEEIYPIGCTSEELKQFIEMTRGDAAGWISFYWGQTIDQLKRSKKIGDAIEAKWLETFNEMNLAGRARN
jgi:hypothetical protein